MQTILASKVERSFPPNLRDFRKSAHGPVDPLPHYRKPLVGCLFKERIRIGLNLFKDNYGSILEMGHGSGILLPFLSTRTGNLFGLDLKADPRLVEGNVRSLIHPGCKLSLVRGNLLDMPFPEGSFSCLVAFSTLEHIEAVEDVLRSFLHVAKPGADVIIGMPSVNRWMKWGFLAIGCREIDELHVMTPQKLKDVFSQEMTLIHHETLLPGPLSLYHVFHFRVPGA